MPDVVPVGRYVCIPSNVAVNNKEHRKQLLKMQNIMKPHHNNLLNKDCVSLRWGKVNFQMYVCHDVEQSELKWTDRFPIWKGTRRGLRRIRGDRGGGQLSRSADKHGLTALTTDAQRNRSTDCCRHSSGGWLAPAEIEPKLFYSTVPRGRQAENDFYS